MIKNRKTLETVRERERESYSLVKENIKKKK